MKYLMALVILGPLIAVYWVAMWKLLLVVWRDGENG